MDTRLLKFYEEELGFIREMGAEFAETYPKIASRLGMNHMEVNDPYVERLLEGYAFMASRVQLELDLQYPVFTQNLLEIVYPHYLAPTPSMTVVRLVPDMAQGGFESGYTVPRGTILRSEILDGEQTACQFSTSQNTVLWPIEIAEADYLEGRGELVAAGLGKNNTAKSALRLRIHRAGDLQLSELPVDRLTLYLSGAGAEPWRLYEAILAKGVAVAGRSTDRRDDWSMELGREIRPRGFDPEEALLPVPGQSFEGYRLLQEYFAMPQRFFFIDIGGLQPAIRRTEGDNLDIYILLEDEYPALKGVSASSFELHAVPAINLFSKRCDRVPVSSTDVDHHVTADRMAPLDYEIYQLEEVVGIGTEGADDVRFQPFYSAEDFTPFGNVTQGAYFSVRRRLRQRSEKQRLKGGRTSYLGTDFYLSLSDRNEAPYAGAIKQLAVRALCTNRDLPLFTPIGKGDTDFVLPDGGPITEARAIVAPTRPRHCLAEGGRTWKMVSHLSLNYLSLVNSDRGSGAAALRELLGLYTPSGETAISKQMEGLVAVDSRPIVRRIADGAMSTAVRGLEIRVSFDESFFEGAGCYVLGSVLETFFAKYVTLNSFTETVLHSHQRGDIARWPAKSGKRQLI